MTADLKSRSHFRYVTSFCVSFQYTSKSGTALFLVWGEPAWSRDHLQIWCRTFLLYLWSRGQGTWTREQGAGKKESGSKDPYRPFQNLVLVLAT